MTKHPSIGYEAEIWSLDQETEEESFVAAGSLAHCKQYAGMLLAHINECTHIFIITTTTRYVWNPDTSAWIPLLTPTDPQ